MRGELQAEHAMTGFFVYAHLWQGQRKAGTADQKIIAPYDTRHTVG